MATVLKNKNFAFSLLATGINSDSSSLTVTTGDGSKFPATGNFRAVLWSASYIAPSLDVNREIITASYSSGDIFAIVRAAEGTVAKSWSTSDKIAHTITAGKIDEIDTEINTHISDTSAHLTTSQNTLLDNLTATYTQLNTVDTSSSISTQLGTIQGNLNSHSIDYIKHLTTSQNTLLDNLTVTYSQLNTVDTSSSITTQLSTIQGNLTSHSIDYVKHLTTDQNTLIDGITVTYTQLNTVDTSSSISTQLGTKAPLISPVFTTPTLNVATCTTLNAITLTALTTGFSLAGGTTSKTLTVDETISISAKAPLASPVFTTQITTPKIVTASGGLTIVPASNAAVTIGDGTVSAIQSLSIDGGTAAGKGAGFSLKKGGEQFFAFYDEATITGSGTSNIPCLFAETGFGMKIFVDGTISLAKSLQITTTPSFGIGIEPLARLHLPAGTTVTNTAPIQFTSGPVETTPRAGLVEYNGRFIVTETDGVNRFLVQAVSSTETTAGAPYTNSGFVTVVINGTTRKLMTTA